MGKYVQYCTKNMKDLVIVVCFGCGMKNAVHLLSQFLINGKVFICPSLRLSDIVPRMFNY